MSHFLVTMALLSLGALLPSCDIAETPTGPPRCEPSSELNLERQLKNGFRHLYEGESMKARGAFSAVLSHDGTHPEALMGLRHAEGLYKKRSLLASRSILRLSGRSIPIPITVNIERFRYEEDAEGRRIRADLTGRPPAKTQPLYGPRYHKTGGIIEFDRATEIQKALNLIVLHDSLTQSARVFFHESAHVGRSTHFTIDFDGVIFQNLDLAYGAVHCGQSDKERRSIAITLVNPLSLVVEALPLVHGSHHRSQSAPTLRQGQKISQWGYTAAQRRSLKKLVAALVGLLPNLKDSFPLDDQGKVTSQTLGKDSGQFRGILGHFHLNPKARDPSVAFPWDELKRYLSTSKVEL